MSSQQRNRSVFNALEAYVHEKAVFCGIPSRLTEIIKAERNVLKLYGAKSISTIGAANKVAGKPLADIKKLNQPIKL